MYRNNFPNDGRMQNRRTNYNSYESSCMNSSCRKPEIPCMDNSCPEPEKPCSLSYHKNEMPCMKDMALAMAYVPWQHFNSLYDLPTGLQIGTIFPELNKPFRCSKGGMKCSCRQ